MGRPEHPLRAGRSRAARSSHPTLADVARQAGVSQTTASLLLNNRPVAVAEKTRRRVFDAARDLRYVANAHVTALKTRRSHALGIHLNEHRRGLFLDDPVLHPVFTGIAEAAGIRRQHLLIYTGLPEYGGEAPAEAFLDRRVDGLLLIHAPEDSGLMSALGETALPCVVLFGSRAPDALGTVDADNAGGARMVVEHLYRLGHRRIAHLTRGFASSNRIDRCLGYRQGLEACGLEWDSRLEIHLASFAEAPLGLSALLSLEVPPTALFCFNDDVAVRAINAAADLGLDVPGDLSVIGFDDSSLAASASPALTTVRQPLRSMGREAAGALVDLIEGVPASERRLVLPVELIVRESCGPPPGRVLTTS